MKTPFVQADEAALKAYSRAFANGTRHVVALNIAVSVWFCRCPQIDGRWARTRVLRLVDESALRRSA
jgi:hypothetical protein